VRGGAAVIVCGFALGVTSYWHSLRGTWWPVVALAVVLVVVAVAYAKTRQVKR